MATSKIEKLSHYAIVMIAVLAVVVSIWQVRIAQEHNRLSVTPFLDSFTGWISQDEWRISLSNEGVGPAIVTGIDYNWNGRTFKNWDKLFEAMGIDRSKRTVSYTFGYPSPFATDKKIEFLGLKISEREYHELYNSNMGVEVVIHYESIYKEPSEASISF